MTRRARRGRARQRSGVFIMRCSRIIFEPLCAETQSCLPAVRSNKLSFSITSADFFCLFTWTSCRETSPIAFMAFHAFFLEAPWTSFYSFMKSISIHSIDTYIVLLIITCLISSSQTRHHHKPDTTSKEKCLTSHYTFTD